MHYQMWFPGKTQNAAKVLQDAGLPDFVDGCSEAVDKLTPDGTPGLLISWSGETGIFPARQRVIDCGSYSLILWVDDPCTEGDLRRQSMFNGYHLGLEDGGDWIIAKAAELPAKMKLVDGKWKTVRKPQFDEFWMQSEKWYRRFMLQELDADLICVAEAISREQLQTEFADFSVFALRQNYRVNREIVSELGLLDSAAVFGIVMRVIDGIEIKEVLDEIRGRIDSETGFEKKDGSPSIIPA